MKKSMVFICAALISLLGAVHRWGDSAHSIGLINNKGGRARHGARLQSGYKRYTLIATAAVIPPCRGDARVALEGTQRPDYSLHLSAPVIDLGFKDLPVLREGVIHNLKKGDHIALWVVMKPPKGRATLSGNYTLAFYDNKNNKSLLRVPVTITPHKEEKDASCEH